MDNISVNYKAWYTRPPIGFDVTSVKAAITSHEQGVFTVSGMLADAIHRDDRIKAVTSTRANGILGLPSAFELDSGDGRKRAQVLATANGLRKVLVSKKTLRRLMRYRLFMGWAMAELVWDTTGTPGQWIPTLKVWHPTHFRYDQIRSTWVLNAQEGQIDIEPGQGKWALFAGEDEQPWLDGLIRSLSIPWLIRQFAYRDWARYSEVHGLPIRKAQVPSQASQDDKDRFFKSVAALGSETTVELPELSNGMGSFDLTLLEAAAQSHDGFKALLDKCEASMAITMLGQNLTTEVKGGSRAAAQVHETVRHDYKTADAEDLASGYEQVMTPWATFNYGDAALAPTLVIDTEPGADLKEDADTMLSLSTAVSNFEGAGFKLDEKELSDKFNFKLTRMTPEEKAANMPPALQPSASQGPQDGQQGPSQPQAQQNAKGHAANGVLLASGSRLPHGSGFVQGQIYADGVADSSTKAGASAMAPDLAAILTAIDNAPDYPTLRENIKAIYGDMDPDTLAAIMEKATILANMAGRLAVMQDI